MTNFQGFEDNVISGFYAMTLPKLVRPRIKEEARYHDRFVTISRDNSRVIYYKYANVFIVYLYATSTHTMYQFIWRVRVLLYFAGDLQLNGNEHPV